MDEKDIRELVRQVVDEALYPDLDFGTVGEFVYDYYDGEVDEDFDEEEAIKEVHRRAEVELKRVYKEWSANANQ